MASTFTIRFKSAREIEQYWLETEPIGGLFVPVKPDVAAGKEVALELVFPDDTFKLRGKVIWRRTTHHQDFKAGLGVAFSADQAQAVKRLLAYTRIAMLDVKLRRSRRIPLKVGIRYDTLLSVARDNAEDISLDGIRITSKSPPAVGENVHVLIHPKGALMPISLKGSVAWRREDCFGMSFNPLSERTQARLRKLVGSLQSDAVAPS